MRRAVLQQVQGFDEQLIAGGNPKCAGASGLQDTASCTSMYR